MTFERVAHMANATGLSIHIGLNQINSKNYGGWDGVLGGCIPDAEDMQAIANAQGLKSMLLTDAEATSKAVLRALKDAAKVLKSGDYLLLTYAGHGGQIPDDEGEEVDDYMDETWLLWDRQLIDDELNHAWSWFEAGVNILVLSDSCHSGTVLFNSPTVFAPRLEVPETDPFATDPFAVKLPLEKARLAPYQVCQRNYIERKAQYVGIKKKLRSHKSSHTGENIRCSVLLISGCQDHELSFDTGSNGVFTNRVKFVWDEGKYRGSHVDFYEAIVQSMPAGQTPNMLWYGVASDSFSNSRPFTAPISISDSNNDSVSHASTTAEDKPYRPADTFE